MLHFETGVQFITTYTQTRLQLQPMAYFHYYVHLALEVKSQQLQSSLVLKSSTLVAGIVISSCVFIMKVQLKLRDGSGGRNGCVSRCGCVGRRW